MIATTSVADYVTLISALAAAIVSIIVAWSQRKLPAQASDVHAAVQMSNGSTLAEAVEGITERNAAVDKAAEPPAA